MLSKTAEYALRAIVWLGQRPEESASANDLAEVTKVPRRYLHTVLQDLIRAGLVRSQTGPGGGYSLAKPPGEIPLLDVVNAVSPLERIRACPLGLSGHTKLCPLHAELDKTYEAAEQAFASVTVESLVLSKSPIVPLCAVTTPKECASPSEVDAPRSGKS